MTTTKYVFKKITQVGWRKDAPTPKNVFLQSQWTQTAAAASKPGILVRSIVAGVGSDVASSLMKNNCFGPHYVGEEPRVSRGGNLVSSRVVALRFFFDFVVFCFDCVRFRISTSFFPVSLVSVSYLAKCLDVHLVRAICGAESTLLSAVAFF